MRVLITGGAGFIGSNLARHLLTRPRPIDVRILDDLSTGSYSNISSLDATFTHASILDEKQLAATAEGVDAIVHLAAIPSVPRSIADPVATNHANITGTLNVLEAARQHSVKQVIVASSSSVYGSNPKLPKNELDWTRPMSPYAVSKLATEGYAIAYQTSYGLDTLAFRFFNVYGPGQAANHAYAAVIPQFLAAALAGSPLKVHGDGLQTRDFTFVGTVCAVIEQALIRRTTEPQPINLAFGTTTSLLELIEVLEAELGHPLRRVHTAHRIGDVRASSADGEQIRYLFPDVSPTPLLHGVRDTVAWFREQRHHG